MWSARDRRCRIGLGLTALLFYVVHAGHLAWLGEPASACWACSLGTVLIGTGLLFNWPTWNGMGLMWLILGVPLWIVELAIRGGLEFTSALIHLGSLLLGFVGTWVMGCPRGVWWKATLLLYLLHWISRWITPEKENINFANRVWIGWETYFPDHGRYILMIVLLSGFLFGGVELALRRMRK
jgi:hypothetical protein